MRRLAFSLLLSAAALASPARAQGGLTVPPRGEIERLEPWLERERAGRERIDERSAPELRRAVADVRLAWAIEPLSWKRYAAVLLDLAGATLRGHVRGVEEEQASPALEVRGLALDALAAHLGPVLSDWIAREVLPLASLPVERRLAALALLEPRRIEPTKLALFSCARDPDPRVRVGALECLVGWQDETVHVFFLETLERARGAAPGPEHGLAERHFAEVTIAPQGRAIARLGAFVAAGLSSTDWREASRAVQLSKPLGNGVVVPWLIEALSAWKTRATIGAQSLRVRFEIHGALASRSGRSLGLEPEPWREWWKAVQQGEVRGVTATTTGGMLPEGTRASFFGLRPQTDRVTFVIDRSRSMAEPFEALGTQARGRTRWKEATEQISAFVEALDDRARFGVVLFHDYAEVWRPRLATANERELRAARDWLDQRPNGGTQLRSGVERALAIRDDGTVDLEVLECDTVIVLCDGATAEGPGWVRPFLERVQPLARVVFHCVQIGAGGDGTLEQLASLTGGSFVRVEG